MRDQKLYIAVRADLSEGLATAQAVHAAFGFALRHPEQTREWMAESQYLVVVSVPDAHAVQYLAFDAGRLGIRTYRWDEPDMNGEPTAVALEPCVASRRLCANLPLHGRVMSSA